MTMLRRESSEIVRAGGGGIESSALDLRARRLPQFDRGVCGTSRVAPGENKPQRRVA